MRSREKFSPAQCRAGRALIGWSPRRLAEAAHIEQEAVELYERGEGMLSTSELIVLGAALNSGGVIALADGWAGEGVRLNRPSGPVARTPFDDEGPSDQTFLEFDRTAMRERAVAIRTIVRRLARILATPLHARGA